MFPGSTKFYSTLVHAFQGKPLQSDTIKYIHIHNKWSK